MPMPFLTAINHRHFDEIGSTNTALIEHISQSQLPHTTHQLYTASQQTAGRGQHGRSWVGGLGNVFLSLYVPIGQGRFDLSKLSGLLSLVVGLQLAKLPIIDQINQSDTTNTPIGVKWANDIGYYDTTFNTFKKLAGILIEPVFKKLDDKNQIVGVVIGVGLNVQHSPIIKDGLYQATCLKERMPDLTLSAQECYTPITNAILQAIELCNGFDDDNTLKNFIKEFNQAHLLQHTFVQIFIQNNMNDVFAKGHCIGIGNNGELLLNNNGTITPIYAGMAKMIKELQ